MRLAPTLVLALSLAPLCGCGINSSSLTTGSTQIPGTTSHSIGGHVHGGQNPVTGAIIQLWAVGTTGYGSPATPLITSTVVHTDPTGYFNISTDYSCAGNPLVYLTATGGNPGTSGDNDNLILVAPLGYCNSLTSSTQITVDEVTTVAAAYAFAQFTNTTTGSIGSYGYSNTGLVNAFTTVNNLVDISMGTALASTPSGVGIPPQSEINTLGNIMASCVNSVSSNASLSPGCSDYFTAATPPAGTAPTDTFDAMVDIARNPGGPQVPTLFNLAVADPPFMPILDTAPPDWTMAIAWKSKLAGAMAFDSAGNLWHLGAPSGSAAISVLSPAGVLTSTPFSNGFFVAVDTNDHAWIYSSGAVTAFQLTTTGGVSSIANYAGPFSVPIDTSYANLAIDGQNNLWIPELNGALYKMNTSGTLLGAYTGGGFDSLADYQESIDNNGNVWLAYEEDAWVSEFSNSGGPLSPSGGFTGGGLTTQRSAPAFDAANDVWLSNGGSNYLTELSPAGTPISPNGGFGGGGQNANTAIAIDGNGTSWIGGHDGISSINSSGVATSPSTAYTSGPAGSIGRLAIDQSGNIWFTGLNFRGSNPLGLVEDIGLAAPVVTPTASAIAMHQLGTLPGTPIPVVLTSTEIPSTYLSAYNAQLYVTGGNTGTYLWSISSGALPSGITLNSSTGLISGSSSVTGTSSFTVKVCDAQNATNCASHAFTLTNPYGGAGLPALGGESLLKGSYIIRVTGLQNAGSSPAPGSVHGQALVGILSLNGSGRVTTGNFFVTNPEGSVEGDFAFGIYDLPAGGTGPGKLAFQDAEGDWYQFSIVADKIVGGVAQELRLTEFDDTQAGSGASGGSMGTGIGKLQTGGSSNLFLQQSFAFGMEGETPCTNYNNTNPACGQTIAPFGPLAVAGVMTGSSATALSGTLDASGVGTSYNNVTFTATGTPPFGTDGFRGFLTLNYTGTIFPAPPAHFVYYAVSDSEFFFISMDGHQGTSLLSGDAIAQSGTFGNGVLNGVYLGVESVASGGDGVSVFGSTVNSAVRFIDSNGTTAALVTDQNDAGTLSQDLFQAASTYSIDSSGRMTFTQPDLPIYYLANGTQGFGVEQPTAGNPPGLITLTQQSNTTFSAASLSGAYGFSTLSVPAQNTTADGILTADGVSAGTITADEVSAGGLLSSPSQSLSYTMPSDGRGTLTLADGSSYILWLLSPTQWIALPTSTDPRPLILTGTKQ